MEKTFFILFTLLLSTMEMMGQTETNPSNESLAWWLLIIIPILLIVPYFLWRKRKDK
ncbi:hypothetical protein LJC57_05210 [Parabacteroides sp. OttesenSCG-928-G07]|nr:hypothetical protein [Parabacteroides sp. OttesenSCG-928-G21]MDL2277973.1 hypothetical protein [Parabacteroides sp. OttesenSCG-928-G07]